MGKVSKKFWIKVEQSVLIGKQTININKLLIKSRKINKKNDRVNDVQINRTQNKIKILL